MTRPGDRMVDVELDDELDAPGAATVDGVPDGVREPAQGGAGRGLSAGHAGPVVHAGRAGRVGHAGRVGRRRSWIATAAALAALALAITWSSRSAQVAERADDALLAAFADVPGISGSLREPTDLAALEAGPPPAAPYTGPTAECPWPITDGALRVCRVFGEPGQGGPTTDAVLGGTPDRLVVLATRDGRVVAERDLGPTAIGWSVLEDDLVVATRAGEAATVERSGATGGELRWRTTVPLLPGVLAKHLQLVADEFVVLSGPAAAVLDAASGEILGTWATAGGRRTPVRVVTSDIGFAVWTAPDEGVWFDRQGAAGAHLPGTPMAPPAVDDGSLPGVLLLADAEVLRAVDVHAGVLWERAAVDAVRVRLDGIVVLEDADGVQAVDLATGEELWSVAGVTAAPGGDVRTDGVRILTTPRAPAGSGTASVPVTAYALRTGTLTWTTP